MGYDYFYLIVVILFIIFFFFFFSSRRRHTRLQGDWSSDVCSSDLGVVALQRLQHVERPVGRAVVHGDDLIGPLPPGAERAPDLFDQERQALTDRKSVV